MKKVMEEIQLFISKHQRTRLTRPHLCCNLSVDGKDSTPAAAQTKYLMSARISVLSLLPNPLKPMIQKTRQNAPSMHSQACLPPSGGASISADAKDTSAGSGSGWSSADVCTGMSAVCRAVELMPGSPCDDLDSVGTEKPSASTSVDLGRLILMSQTKKWNQDDIPSATLACSEYSQRRKADIKSPNRARS